MITVISVGRTGRTYRVRCFQMADGLNSLGVTLGEEYFEARCQAEDDVHQWLGDYPHAAVQGVLESLNREGTADA